VNKKQLSERDICTQFITPALEQAGWDTSTQIREEFPLTKGRIVVRSYNLDCKNPHEVEVNHRDPEELMQEYKDIAGRLEEAQNALKKELMQALGGKA
jgi:type I restriction enzyme M protein